MSDQFWSRVIRSDGCWEWTGALNTHGYGWVTIHRKQHGAHRVAWTLINGQIPEGRHVLHTCDNRRCVNPAHLYLGSHSDNMKDRANRRRCKLQKLSEADVIAIRRLRAKGWTCQAIADRFGISNGHVSAVARGIHYGQ